MRRVAAAVCCSRGSGGGGGGGGRRALLSTKRKEDAQLRALAEKYTAPRVKRYRDLSKPAASWTVRLPRGTQSATVLEAIQQGAPWLSADVLQELANTSGIRDAVSGHLLSWGDLQRPMCVACTRESSEREFVFVWEWVGE